MTLTPLVAWTLARLLAGLAVSGAELMALPDPFRRLAVRLAETPPEGRTAIVDAYSLGLIDPAAFLEALADAAPNGPPPAAEAAGPPGPRARLTRADGIEARPVEWLWRGRLPLGMMTVFAGDPKLGKSYVSLALSAAVSRGASMPDGDHPDGPGSVVLMSAEDDPGRVIVPRLRAAGADLSKIHVLESIIRGDGSEALPSLKADMVAIEAAADRLRDCRLIVIDPVSAYLGGTDDHKNAELRGVLSPLKAMAERLNLAIILLSHLSKAGGANAKHRVIGSVAYVGACRANFLFAKDRNDPAGRRVLMLDIGGNLAPAAPTLAYVIEDRGDGPRVEWLDEPLPITAEQALLAEQEARQPARPDHERREAETWLREVLSAGPVAAREIEAAARDAGFAIRTLKRAKESVGAESFREGFGKESACYWRLADALNH